MEECKRKGRSLGELKKCCSLTGVDRCLGSIHLPLFNIELDHVIVDELHLWLRIVDRLITALILCMAQLDCHAHVRGTSRGHISHVDKLVSTIQSCGIHFKVRALPL